MKFVVYGPEHRLGVIQGDRILDLRNAATASRSTQEDATRTLLTFIESGHRGLDAARSLLQQFEMSDQPGLHVDVASAQLQAPFPGRRLAFAGRNVAAHVANALTNHGTPTSTEEVFRRTRAGKAGGFWKVTSPVGPGSEVPVPVNAHGLFDYEAEVAVVLGAGGKRLASDEWTEKLWGVVLAIDWSIRGQTEATSVLPFYGHKNFDASTSLGPWIAVDEVDPSNCDVVTTVNGQERQSFNTREMIHSFGELLAQMSEDITLLPGDVLSGGTGAGTAVDATAPGDSGNLSLDLFLSPGDSVEVSSPGLGVLPARIVAST
jgi:2-keto-4-pentenoate hydratase/2-oxohepta-3-ene-1,7-dioic acid hydratase in catechol pathway